MKKKKALWIALAGGLTFGGSWTIANYLNNGEITYSGLGGALAWFVLAMLTNLGRKDRS